MEIFENTEEEFSEKLEKIEELVEIKKKIEKTSKTTPEKTDDELVREYSKGKRYDIKDPKTYKAILKIVKGK